MPDNGVDPSVSLIIDAIQGFPQQVELASIDSLRPHPRNYQEHPDDQLEHIVESIRQHRVYRNVVTARDRTILAGHGVVKALERMGATVVPIIRLDLDPDDPRVLQILIGDNEVGHLAVRDDRKLTEMLKELQDQGEQGLLGTGFDGAMLAALVYNTRPKSEMQGKNEASQWVGMPEYDEGERALKVIMLFRSQEDHVAFALHAGLEFANPNIQTISVWWPPREREDLSSLRFEG